MMLYKVSRGDRIANEALKYLMRPAPSTDDYPEPRQANETGHAFYFIAQTTDTQLCPGVCGQCCKRFNKILYTKRRVVSCLELYLSISCRMSSEATKEIGQGIIYPTDYQHVTYTSFI